MSTKQIKLSPSLLARKMICSAYKSAPMSPDERLRFIGFHSRTMITVIKRHLQGGYRLIMIEATLGNNARVDLVFQDRNGLLRTVEVKSARQLTELHQLQAALYWTPNTGEIAVSNGQEDLVLSETFIGQTLDRARNTVTFLTSQPDLASKQYNPTQDLCRLCANSTCPYNPKATLAPTTEE